MSKVAFFHFQMHFLAVVGTVVAHSPKFLTHPRNYENYSSSNNIQMQNDPDH